MAEKKDAPDWERIESHYRAGALSLREIAAADGNVTEGAIRKRAKRDGWERDLGQKIRAKADALVRKDAVRNEVREKGAHSERQIVDANAQSEADIRLDHNAHVRRARGVLAKMWEEVAALPEAMPTLTAMASALDAGDEGRMREILGKAVSLPSRATTVKTLVEASVKAITIEREILGLNETAGDAEKGKTLTDAERASRLATLLERARKAADDAAAG